LRREGSDAIEHCTRLYRAGRLHGVAPQGEIRVGTGRGRFAAKLVSVNLHRLWVRRLSDNLPRIAHSADDPAYANIAFRIKAGPSLRRSGEEMLRSDITRRGDGEVYFQQSEGDASFGSVSLLADDLVAAGAAVIGCDLSPLRDALIVTPPAAALERLHRLHEAAGFLAEYAPEVIAHPSPARGLEHALIDALVGCFKIGEVGEDRSALRRHNKIIRRFHEATENNPDQALFIPDLCAEIGVTERTLRVCCEEYLGTSPKRYLMLRRMHHARKALREGSRDTTTVTEVAAQWGFWNFGRFAGEYKAFFEESPSATLARRYD
jgi:AraC-like DNA-binding protein